MSYANPPLGALLALLVLIAAFVMAVAGTMTWLVAGLLMGLALAIILRGP